VRGLEHPLLPVRGRESGGQLPPVLRSLQGLSTYNFDRVGAPASLFWQISILVARSQSWEGEASDHGEDSEREEGGLLL
jgi:hypothetical protein